MFLKILMNIIEAEKCKILIIFNDMITVILSNKKPIVMVLFIRGRKLNLSLFLFTISYCCTKIIRLNSTHYFIMKMPKKQ